MSVISKTPLQSQQMFVNKATSLPYGGSLENCSTQIDHGLTHKHLKMLQGLLRINTSLFVKSIRVEEASLIALTPGVNITNLNLH
jgi:hypothetical protein